MPNRFDVEQWLKEQEKIKGEVFIKDGNYYKWSGRRNPTATKISNFVLKATAKIEQDRQWWFECAAVNNTGIICEKLILSSDDLQSVAAFKSALAGDSCIGFYGDGNDVTHIKCLLTSQNPALKAGTDKLGIHLINGRWVYVEGNQVVDSNGIVNDIVFTNTNLNADELPTLLQQPDLTVNERTAIAENFNQFNGPAIVYPLMGWIGFCFSKNRLAHKVNNRNLILLCQGEPGVGKTETISRIVQPIFGSKRPISNIADVTKFTMAVNGSRSNITPVCYDEWKYSVMNKSRIKDLDSMLLSTFNQTNLPRGKADQTVCEYRFTSPTVVCGEMTMESPSLKHRMLELFFNKKGRTGREAYFHTLSLLPLGSLGKGLLLNMLSISDERLNSVFDEQKASVDPSIDDRFRDSAALVRVGLWLIIDYFIGNGIAVDEYIKGYNCIDNAIKESLYAAQITNIEKILYDFSVMAHTQNCEGNWLKDGYHFEQRDNLLYVKIAESYDLYRKFAKTNPISSEVMNKSSFLQQLATRPYFEGKKTVKIAGKACNGICINLKAIPDCIEVNFA